MGDARACVGVAHATGLSVPTPLPAPGTSCPPVSRPQFESLAISPRNKEASLLVALQLLAGSTVPRRVTCSGFSLGGALSELCGIWAAILWPGTDILVANQVSTLAVKFGGCLSGVAAS